MEIGPQILFYTAWVVVAIAGGGIAYHLLARRNPGRDRAVLTEAGASVGRRVVLLLQALLRTLRDRAQPLEPAVRAEFLDHQTAGIRIALYLVVPIALLGGYWAGKEWELVFFLCGLIYVPAVTIPMSVAHTWLLRFLGSRGIVASIAAGLFIGVVVSRIITLPDFIKASVMYGGVYGLIVGLGNTALPAPGLIADDRPRTLEEQAKADGLSS